MIELWNQVLKRACKNVRFVLQFKILWEVVCDGGTVPVIHNLHRPTFGAQIRSGIGVLKSYSSMHFYCYITMQVVHLPNAIYHIMRNILRKSASNESTLAMRFRTSAPTPTSY